MKELERLEKRIKLGGRLAAIGAILFFSGNIAVLIVAVVFGDVFTMRDAVLAFIGPALFGLGLCIMPTPRAVARARENALWELRMRHAIKDMRKSG